MILKNVTFVTEDDNNEISIDEHTSIMGKTELAAIESTSIKIGKDCLFSQMIYFRTGDSHSIIDMDGNRINQSKNIIVGDHVWLGQQVVLLKGAEIPANSIVGYRSIVTKKLMSENTAYAGSPAKEVKNNVTWDSKRI